MIKSTYIFWSALLIPIILNPQDKKINFQLNVVGYYPTVRSIVKSSEMIVFA